MTPSNWLFFPSPSNKLVLTMGNLVDPGGKHSGSRWNITTGDSSITGTDDVANNYEFETTHPIQKSTALGGGNSIIMILFKVKSSGDYSNAQAWSAAVGTSLDTTTSNWEHDGSLLTVGSITTNHHSFGSVTCRVRFNGTTTNVDNFWNTMSAGETSTVTLNWT